MKYWAKKQLDWPLYLSAEFTKYPYKCSNCLNDLASEYLLHDLNFWISTTQGAKKDCWVLKLFEILQSKEVKQVSVSLRDETCMLKFKLAINKALGLLSSYIVTHKSSKIV